MTWNETPENNSSPSLGSLLAQRVPFNWEVAVYVVILVLAVFTRFYNLGDRVMSHDESLHTRFSYNLYHDGNFQHTPLMHGPILFHMVALNYSLFGDSDFSARIYPALLGVLMVLTPLLFRHWLKRWGSLIASILILISPLLMFYNRYIREDTPAIMAGILMIWGMLMYLSGPPPVRRKGYWLYIIAFGMIWNLGTKETAFMYIFLFGVFLLLYWLVRLAQFFANQRGVVFAGKSIFALVSLAIMMGGVLALGMYIILDVVQFDLVGGDVAFSSLQPTQQSSYLVWTFLAILLVVSAILATVVIAFRHQMRKLPIGQIALFLGIMFASAFVLVVAEELSHVAPTVTSEPAAQPVPGEEGVTTAISSTLRMTPMIAVWLVSIGTCVFFFVIRRRADDIPASPNEGIRGTGVWGVLDLFPEFDVMVVIGTLVLPWATALVPYLMKGTIEDFTAIGNMLPPFLLNIIRTIPNIGTTDQVGQFLLGLMAWIPLMITSFVIGLSWNWKRWLIAAGVFYSVFFFFFTTMFTNLAGIGTGMYYSLGYWLEQQGVRRGSQPQYYYLLIIMPMYEFLVVVGSILAMNTGLFIFWRRYREEQALKAEMATAHWAEPQPTLLEDTTSETVDGGVIESTEIVDEQVNVGELLVESAEKPKRVEPANLDALIALNNALSLQEMPFLLWWGWLSVFNLILFTFAGEKMPWLGTHMAYPMIIVTAWFLGGIVTKLNVEELARRWWVQVPLTAVFVITILQVFGTVIAGNPIFAGLSSQQLQDTQNWLASVVVMFITAVGLAIIAYRSGLAYISRLLTIALFVFMGVLTIRSAWTASFINYDDATEFLVYAHAAPAIKTVLNQIEDLSLRTTDGMGMKFAYDNEVSWPYSWYFRNFTNAVFVGSNPTVQNLDGAVVVVVGSGNRGKVEPLLEDSYQKFEYNRMWWPMQEYFYLNADRVNNLLDFSATNTLGSQIRKAIFDIWMYRDYTAYGTAINKDFSLPNWPVSDTMYVYVRKDVVAQVWNYGTGDGTVVNPLENVEENVCNANWQDLQPLQIITADGSPLNRPIGLAFDGDGQLYVAEESNHRVSIFDAQGNYVRSLGTFGTALDGIQFNRPNAVTVGSDGLLYVVDTWNYRIDQIALGDDIITARWGQSGTYGFDAPTNPTDAFWGPRDVKISADGLVYVTDTGNKRIRVYRLENGTPVWLYDIGAGGSGPGELDEPAGIAIHPVDGRIFVADSWNRRISVFTKEGVFLNTYPVKAWYERLGNAPYIAVDPTRELLYTTDPDGGRVLVLTTAGECVGSFGSVAGESPLPNQFRLASGIEVDKDGNVYVSDGALGRILKFAPFPMPETVLEPQTDQNSAEITPESTSQQ